MTGRMCLLHGQKRLEDEYKYADVLPKVNRADLAGTMEYIKEHLRLFHGVVRTPLAYIIKKIIIVQTYGDYPAYATPDNEMIARMLHLPPNKNRLHDKQIAQPVKECTAEYKIDNRRVDDILNQIYKNTNLY